MAQPIGHVLIVEDDFAIRDALTQILEDEGYHVEGAVNGQEAIHVLGQITTPCVILLDLMMPVMNGWQFREAQRQDPALAPIPVVVISADSSAQDKLGDIDPIGFLHKPVQLGPLLSLIEQACG